MYGVHVRVYVKNAFTSMKSAGTCSSRVGSTPSSSAAFRSQGALSGEMSDSSELSECEQKTIFPRCRTPAAAL